MYMIKVIALKQQKNKEIELFTATLKPLKKREMRLFLGEGRRLSGRLSVKHLRQFQILRPDSSQKS